MTNAFADAANAIRSGKCVVASTGAGMSAESGIPTFRGEGGIWTKYPPENYATIYAYTSNPMRVWEFWRELSQLTSTCKPNPGHRALAELESKGHLHAIITQNVDNLHQEAGSKRVIEYHGNARRVCCMRCRHTEPLDPLNFPACPPHCFCGGLMKPDVVMFGELIPTEALEKAEHLAQTCDVLLVVGTSAQVFPAAQLPITAKQHGATVIEINIEQTDFTGGVTDIFLEGPAGVVLPALVERLSTQ